jgi:hypothetical protein
MTQDIAPTTTRPAPLPGHTNFSSLKINGQYRTRAAVSQVATSTLTDGFNGARDLGIIFDGLIALVENSANVAAWVIAMNVLLSGKAVLTYNAPTLTVTCVGSLPHTLTPYNPSTPDLELSAFTITTVATNSPVIRPGMAVVWKDRVIKTVQAPLPGSVIADYVGMVDRATEPPKRLAEEWADGAGTFGEGMDMLLQKVAVAYVLVYPGTVVVDADPVYMGRLAAEAGYYYNADDGGNTRLLIPNAQFIGGGTAPADNAYGMQVFFQP